MRARARDEASALKAAEPLVRHVGLWFRDPRARDVVQKRIKRYGQRWIEDELRQQLAGRVVVAFADMTRGKPLPATHAGRRCMIDTCDLFIWELDGWLVARARGGLVDSLRLANRRPDPRDRHFLVKPSSLEEPGVVRDDDDDDTETVAPIRVGVDVASAAERRALLVVDDVAVAQRVHLRPRLLKVAQVLDRKMRRLTVQEREARLREPAFRAELARVLGCKKGALRVYLCELRAAAAAL